MIKSYKYRIFPSPNQKHYLHNTLNECRYIYNTNLALKKNLYKYEKKTISKFEMINEITRIRLEKNFQSHSQVLQEVGSKVDKSFKNFFRRCKNNDKKLGYPRFKSENQYHSFSYPQSGFKIITKEDNRDYIYLSKLGYIRIKKHRDIQGKIKTCFIKVNHTGKWYVIFSCEIENIVELNLNKNNMIGLDLGIRKFLVTSDKEIISNPKFLKKDEKDLNRANSRFSKNKTRKNRIIRSKIYERINNRKDNFLHQTSRRLVNKYDYIVVEKLNINNMLNTSKRLNKDISEVSWNKFMNFLSYKVEETGKKVIFIDPRNTSKTCSNCLKINKTLGSKEVFECKNCGYIKDRDLNASYNIKRLGHQSLNLEIDFRSPRL